MAGHPVIASVGTALPPHRYSQAELAAALTRYWSAQHKNPDRLAQLHEAVQVGGRALALPIEAYERLRGFGDANDAFIRAGTDAGEQALAAALQAAGIAASQVDALFFTTVTGVAVPTIDARLINRMGLRRDLKRTPLFGLGCVAGAASLARAADYLRGHPDDVAAVLSVELCSLTIQPDDLSIPNLIATGLFGDGAAAVILAGDARARRLRAEGPRIVATGRAFYPDTERVMGWDVGDRGFRIVLSASVPEVVERNLGADVDAFLSAERLTRADVSRWICHPGGPKVLDAVQRALGLAPPDLHLSRASLREIGNLSSASVLFVLGDTLRDGPPKPGARGVLLAMGPGFCTELVLLRW